MLGRSRMRGKYRSTVKGTVKQANKQANKVNQASTCMGGSWSLRFLFVRSAENNVDAAVGGDRGAIGAEAVPKHAGIVKL